LEVDIVNAECLMTNDMARTEQCQNRERTTIIAAGGVRKMVVVVGQYLTLKWFNILRENNFRLKL
jgi:hypothetical protein